jgi:hypothetical protein
MVKIWSTFGKGGKGEKGGNLAINILKIKPFIQNF